MIIKPAAGGNSAAAAISERPYFDPAFTYQPSIMHMVRMPVSRVRKLNASYL